MNRSLKKFLYGLFYLACFAGIVFLFVRPIVRVAPTCFDSIKNQDETGVDCGGPCVSCAEKNLLPLQVLQQYTLPLSSGQSTLLFGVANPNSNFHATSFTYHVEVFDKNGTMTEQFSGIDSLYANERKFLLEPRITAQFSNIGNITVTLSDTEWQSTENVAAPVLSLSGITTEVLPQGSIRVSGTASNTSGNTARDVRLLAVAYSKYGSRIFASQNILTSLLGFQSTSFTIPFPTDAIFQNVDATKTEVFISSR